MRAQIVPIASRREISQPPAPVAEPAPPPPPVAPPPPPVPAAVVAPPRPVVEEKAPVVPDKSAKTEKPGKSDKYDRYDKYDKAPKVDRPAKSEPPVAKAAPVAPPPPAPKVEKPEKAEKAAPLPVALAPEIEAPATGGGKAVKLLLAAVASIALFVGLFVYPGWLHNNSKPTAPARGDDNQLQLKVERANGELLLTWNPDAEVIKSASKAVLSINDGDQKENVDMDLAQLAQGKIVYSPTGSDIRFEMKVTDKAGKTTSEPVRMLRPPSPLQESNGTAAKATTPAAITKPVAGVTPPGAAPTANGEPAPEQPAKPAAAPLKPFQQSESLAQRLRPAAPTDMPDAPTASTGSRSATSAIPGVNINPIAPAPLAPSAPAAASTDSKPKSGGQIQQAVLIYRKDAEYPKIARQTGAKGTVSLTATIGADGTIKKVKVISGHPMLTNSAVEAVKQWRYRPTLLNGQPVESETGVQINFVGDR